MQKTPKARTKRPRREVLNDTSKRRARVVELYRGLVSKRTIVETVAAEFRCGERIVYADYERAKEETTWALRGDAKAQAALMIAAWEKLYWDALKVGELGTGAVCLREIGKIRGVYPKEGMSVSVDLSLDAEVVAIVNEIRGMTPSEREAKLKELDAIDIELEKG